MKEFFTIIASIPRPVFSFAWGMWAIWFIVWEGLALMNKSVGDTLSEHVWRFVGKGWNAAFLVGLFMFWLTIHFLTRGRWG